MQAARLAQSDNYVVGYTAGGTEQAACVSHDMFSAMCVFASTVCIREALILHIHPSCPHPAHPAPTRRQLQQAGVSPEYLQGMAGSLAKWWSRAGSAAAAHIAYQLG